MYVKISRLGDYLLTNLFFKIKSYSIKIVFLISLVI